MSIGSGPSGIPSFVAASYRANVGSLRHDWWMSYLAPDEITNDSVADALTRALSDQGYVFARLDDVSSGWLSARMALQLLVGLPEATDDTARNARGAPPTMRYGGFLRDLYRKGVAIRMLAGRQQNRPDPRFVERIDGILKDFAQKAAERNREAERDRWIAEHPDHGESAISTWGDSEWREQS